MNWEAAVDQTGVRPVATELCCPMRRVIGRSRAPSTSRMLSRVAAPEMLAAVRIVPVVRYSEAGIVPSVTGRLPGEPGLLRYWVMADLATLAAPSTLRTRLLCRTLAMAGTPMAMMAAITARTARISTRVKPPRRGWVLILFMVLAG